MTTKDFVNFPPARLFYDGGFNVIDATILPANGKFHLVVKDETKNSVKKNLRRAASGQPEGPCVGGESTNLTFPKGFRHGTVLRAPAAVEKNLSAINQNSTNTSNTP